MKQEIKQNFEEKLRLVNDQLLKSLDGRIKIMSAEHARDGMLKSGNTVKKVMDFIESENLKLYQEVISHLKTLKPNYYSSLESDIFNLAISSQKLFGIEALERLKKITNHIDKNLLDKILPNVEKSMASQLANFQNDLNVAILEIKSKTHTSPFHTALWCLEGILLLISMFIAGMWYKNPNGNYEPALFALALVIPLIVVLIKLGGKK